MSQRADEGGRFARLRFDRNELSGAFGDIGTDFPLIAGLILVAGLEPASVLVMFGAMQLFTGITYGIPMPAQPLKAMAAIVITQRLDAELLYGGGLAIGVLMLALTITGLIGWLARSIPVAVVRGIQFGLGLQLVLLAIRDYVPAEGRGGWVLAVVTFAVVIALLGNRRFPPALFAIALGIIYALLFRFDAAAFGEAIGLSLPHFEVPRGSAITQGLVLLAIPQLPLSLGNSVLATHRLVDDLFPERRLGVRKISLTYALMNLVNPFFGGVPACHGSGGIVGHYQFGARTGGSVVIYGTLYLALGLFAAAGFGEAVQLFPLPVLGVILAFEGAALMRTVTRLDRPELGVALMVGAIAAAVPYGYVVGALFGVLLFRGLEFRRRGSGRAPRR